MKRILLKLIDYYQSHISDIKGFKCAYGEVHGNGTCSSRIKNVVLTKSVLLIPVETIRQFHACQIASKRLNEDNNEKKDKSKGWCVAMECGAWSCPLFMTRFVWKTYNKELQSHKIVATLLFWR